MEYWFITYKLGDGIYNDMIEVPKEESPNVDWYRFEDAAKRELVDTTFSISFRNVDDIVILNFIQVNKEDK